jgi:restriction system protein
MAAKGAVGGYVVTSGVFTSEAKAFADGRNIELIDGAKLTQLLKEVKTSGEAISQIEYPMETESRLNCPRCGSAMIRRRARQGSNAGKEFWGCSQYPMCKGIKPT